MKNNNELKDLINSSFEYPKELDDLENRLNNRLKKIKRKRLILTNSILTFVCALFIILVNVNSSFANVISQVPVINNLLKYITHNESLNNAIDNNYIQEVNLVSKNGKTQIFLPYIIADQKKLVLFFKLPEKMQSNKNEKYSISQEEIKNSLTGDNISWYNGEFNTVENPFGFIVKEYAILNENLPQNIDVEIQLEKKTYFSIDNDSIVDKNCIYESLGKFNFKIKLNEFSNPKIYNIDKKYSIMDQYITLENIKVYPTGTEVNFSLDKENSSYIRDIDLKIIKNGSTYYKSKNSLSTIYNYDNENISIYIDSNYFGKDTLPEKILITSLNMLPKNEEYITVDIKNKTIETIVNGLTLKDIIRKSNESILIFESQTINKKPLNKLNLNLLKETDLLNIFYNYYYDSFGNIYKFNTIRMSNLDKTLKEISISVRNTKNNKIILQRYSGFNIFLEEPFIIEFSN